jgi:hypothetical protein
VLQRILGPKRDHVIRSCRKLHNEELNNVYRSSKIIRMTKSRRRRWAGRVQAYGEDEFV